MPSDPKTIQRISIVPFAGPLPPVEVARHSHQICCLALSADGKLLASADLSGDVRIWELAKKPAVLELHVEEKPVQLRFSADRYLVTLLDNGNVLTWDLTITRPE